METEFGIDGEDEDALQGRYARLRVRKPKTLVQL
jgi:hypothetical protein